ncbi:hypothetical protein H2200_001702 [Cladophialophora chaetospira]|uniref:Uncharacterized protein n=1 Tax=Cladophialophora chaetospira TaxID=386627 RepID=A0AA38XLD5_9EURO|nr:hypothetical protein H2200_001702 [Cladophialophora chaetospira]
MDAETKALIRQGLHPDQLSLTREHSVKFYQRESLRAIENLQAQWEERFDRYEAGETDALDRKPKLEAEAPRAPQLRRITRRLPLKNRTAIRKGYFEHPAIRNQFELTNVADYHAFAYDRTEFFSCNNPICQQLMRCGMAEMPNPKNKAWRILNLGDSKSSTPVSKKTSSGLVSKWLKRL